MIVKDCTLLKPLSCGVDDTAVAAARKLRDAEQRRILVVESGKPVGIISTTDINNRVVAAGKDPAKLKAKDIMSKLYLTCGLDDELSEVYGRMVKHSSYFCPVTKEGKLFGILTYGELSKQVQQRVRDAKDQAA